MAQFEVEHLRLSPTDVLPQERSQRSAGTLRNPDIGGSDARSVRLREANSTPIHSVGRRKVPRPAVAALRMASRG